MPWAQTGGEDAVPVGRRLTLLESGVKFDALSAKYEEDFKFPSLVEQAAAKIREHPHRRTASENSRIKAMMSAIAAATSCSGPDLSGVIEPPERG